MAQQSNGGSWITRVGASLLAAFTGLAMVAGPAHASEVDVLIEKLAQKGLLTRLEAETMRGDIEMAEKSSYVKHRGETNPWLADLTSKGDVRLRYEGFNREQQDADDRNRYRFRVRWGLEKRFSDEWRAGFRIASGAGTNEATSTNVTLENEFGLKQVFFDQAYGIWSPTARVKEFLPNTLLTEVGAGKVANPYEKWGTSIIWDGDVTPEGIYEKWDYKLMDVGTDGRWELNVLAGQWVVDENSGKSATSVGDVNMFSYGVGTYYTWMKDHDANFKFTYYDWNDLNNYYKVNTSALASTFGGNDREIADYKILNFYLETNFPVQIPAFGTQNLKLYGDYAYNQSEDDYIGDSSTDETLRNVAYRENENDAFSVGFAIGKPKVKGDWMFNYEYYHVEANAVVGSFAESDLGLGYANNQGHRLAYKYLLTDALELNFTAWIVEKINTTILTYQTTDNNPNGDDQELLRTQLDLVYKF